MNEYSQTAEVRQAMEDYLDNYDRVHAWKIRVVALMYIVGGFLLGHFLK